MNKRFAGKVALITGASKGIGASIAKDLAKEGAAIIVNYSSSKNGADKVVLEITRDGGKAIAIQANMANEQEIRHLFSETKKAFGRLDILVNNAGVYDFTPIEELTAQSYHRMFDLNVLGLLLASKEAIKYFDGAGGNIINISSIVSISTPPQMSIYNATKAAVDAITKSLAKELGPKNIRVNAVNPGLIETEGTQAKGFLGDDFRKEYEAGTPLKRIGQPKDVAQAVTFLASDDSSWITGETFLVSGGFTTH